MCESSAVTRDDSEYRSLFKPALFVPTKEVIRTSSDKVGGICIPMVSKDLDSRMLSKTKGGGFLKLVNPNTGQQVFVPTQPFNVESGAAIPMDQLNSEDLKSLQSVLEQNANHEVVNKARDDAMALQSEAMSSYKPKKPVESHPDAAYILLPSSKCLRMGDSLSFSSTIGAITAINPSLFRAAHSSCLRLSHDPQVQPSVELLFPPRRVEEEDGEEQFDRLRSIEDFTTEFRKQRIELGFTQNELKDALFTMYGIRWSQTTISRFEALCLGMRQTRNVIGRLKQWLRDVQTAVDREVKGIPYQQPLLKEDEDSNFKIVSVTCSGRDKPLAVRVEKTETAKLRKRRTNLPDDSLVVLETAFDRWGAPSGAKMRQLADSIKQPLPIVRAWFSNRKAKQRRMEGGEFHDTKGILNLDADELAIVPEVGKGP